MLADYEGIMEPLDAMAVFARVVETESFSGAARALGLSKSAISKQIRRLEDRFGPNTSKDLFAWMGDHAGKLRPA